MYLAGKELLHEESLYMLREVLEKESRTDISLSLRFSTANIRLRFPFDILCSCGRIYFQDDAGAIHDQEPTLTRVPFQQLHRSSRTKHPLLYCWLYDYWFQVFLQLLTSHIHD